MPPRKFSTSENLALLHDALSADLVRFEASLPEDADDVSESFERYARVISLLIRSMNLLYQREESLRAAVARQQKPRQDIIADLERAVDRILAEETEDAVSKRTQ